MQVNIMCLLTLKDMSLICKLFIFKLSLKLLGDFMEGSIEGRVHR
jgi:hypothetical protein